MMQDYIELRSAFIKATRDLGERSLDYIAATDPGLSAHIRKAFSSRGRAAFWLVMDKDHNQLTPLLQLAKGQRDVVWQRLEMVCQRDLKL